MKKLAEKVVIITGTSSGIGKQVAIRFAQEGAKLAFCARRANRLEETKRLCEEAGAEVFSMACDLTNEEELQKFFDATIAHFGTVDVLVNNAISDAVSKPFIEQTWEQLNSMLKLGLFVPWRLMQLCYPIMKDNRRGSIINVGSASGTAGIPGYAAYASTKEALRGLTRLVSHEWGAVNIRVNSLLPSSATDSLKDDGILLKEEHPQLKEEREAILKMMAEANPLKRVGDSYEDIAPVFLFLASDDSRYITGQTLCVDGGFSI